MFGLMDLQHDVIKMIRDLCSHNTATYEKVGMTEKDVLEKNERERTLVKQILKKFGEPKYSQRSEAGN